MSGEQPGATSARPGRARWLWGIAGALAALVVLGLWMGTRSPTDPGRSPPNRLPSGDRDGDRGGAGSSPTSGGERLDGLVVDGAGAAVPGATITLTREPEAGEPAPSSAPAARGQSDAKGAFSIVGVPAARYRLRVDGDAIFAAEVRFVSVPSDALRVVVARQVSIAGHVIDGSEAMTGATVEVAGDALAGTLTVTAGQDGGFVFTALPEGNYQVWAHRGDLAARAQPVLRVGPGPFAAVVLRVEPAAIVVGKVRERGSGVGLAAAIELRPSCDSSDEPPRYVRSGDDGVFRIEGVHRGRWLASAWAPGYLVAEGLEFEAGKQLLALELVAGGVVEGTVVDDAGRPIAGAAISGWATGPGGETLEASADAELRLAGRRSGAPVAPIVAPAASDDRQFVARGELGVLLGPIPFPAAAAASSTRYARVVDPQVSQLAQRPGRAPPPMTPRDPSLASTWVTAADGRFRITALAPASWTLVARAAGKADGRRAGLRVDLGKTLPGITITLAAGVWLVGTVRDDDGPLAGAVVEVKGQGTGPAVARAEAVTGPDGTYRIGPFSGEVTIRASAYAHSESTRSLRLGGGPELHHDFELVEADEELAGMVEDPTGLPLVGAAVQIVGGAAAGRRTLSGDGGRFAIRNVPPGRHAVRVEHPDFPPLAAEATADQPAQLRVAFGGGIEAWIIDRHTGANLGGVPVTAVGPGGERHEASSALNGLVSFSPLAAGTWRLTVRVPGYLPSESTFRVTAGARPREVTVRDARLEVERGALVGGVVRDRYGSRVPGAEVVVRRRGDDAAVARSTTDLDGVFRVRDAPTGRVTVEARKDGQVGRTELEPHAGDELLSLELELR